MARKPKEKSEFKNKKPRVKSKQEIAEQEKISRNHEAVKRWARVNHQESD